MPRHGVAVLCLLWPIRSDVQRVCSFCQTIWTCLDASSLPGRPLPIVVPSSNFRLRRASLRDPDSLQVAPDTKVSAHVHRMCAVRFRVHIWRTPRIVYLSLSAGMRKGITLQISSDIRNCSLPYAWVAEELLNTTTRSHFQDSRDFFFLGDLASFWPFLLMRLRLTLETVSGPLDPAFSLLN